MISTASVHFALRSSHVAFDASVTVGNTICHEVEGLGRGSGFEVGIPGTRAGLQERRVQLFRGSGLEIRVQDAVGNSEVSRCSRPCAAPTAGTVW